MAYLLDHAEYRDGGWERQVKHCRPICGKRLPPPEPRGRQNSTCGDPLCVGALISQTRRAAGAAYRAVLEAPEIPEGYFAPHNVPTRDGGPLRMSRPDSVYGSGMGSAGAWVTEW